MISADTLLTYIVQAAFVFLGLWSIVEYVRFRDPIRRDIALMFSSLAAVTATSFINEFFNLDIPTMGGTLLLVAQPYLLLRLVQYFHPIPRWINFGALAAMAGSWLVLILGGSVLQLGFTLAIVLYFVLINGYAMVNFIKCAWTTQGITHRRLQFTAVGSGLLALALALIGLSALFPSWAEILSRLVQVAALGAALTYYLGLAPPYWLRRTWQFQELHRFHQQLSPSPTTVPEMYNILCQAARNATGGRQAAVAYSSRTRPSNEETGETTQLQSWQLYIPHQPERACPQLADSSLFSRREQRATAVPANTLTADERSCLQLDSATFIYLVPLMRQDNHWGCLLVMLDQGSLFAGDDLELLQDFAQHTTVVLQNLDLIEKLNRDANLLEEQVQQRTAELAQRNTYINLLQEITVAANEATSLDEPLEKAINLICEAMNLPVGHVYAPTETEPMTLTSKSIWYLKEPERYEQFRALTEATPFSLNLGGVGQAVTEARPLRMQNLGKNPGFLRAEAAAAGGLQTGLFIPVFVGNEIMAVLEFFSDEAIEPNELLLNLLVNVGTQLGRVIERKETELKIRQSEEKLQQLNQELERRVAKRTAHLAAVNKELEAFSYSVSHDLRAPLRAVDGFSQALLEDYHAVLDDEGKEFLDLIRLESQRMGQLIDDLLDLSRYTRTDIERETIDLSSMAQEIASALQNREPERQVEFAIEGNLMLSGDKRLIRVVLQNLLDNAWKYTKKEAIGYISLGTTAQNGDNVFFVKDNGVGFDMTYVHKLFGTFQRLHSVSEFEGTGIGLATVQRIIHRHGGKIWAEGTVGEGATIYFTLEAGGAAE